MNARAAGPEQDEATRWMADPSRLLRVCDAAVPRLVALPAATPSLRLLADQPAELLGGISPALNGLALLVADPARPVARSRGRPPPPHPGLASSFRQCRAHIRGDRRDRLYADQGMAKLSRAPHMPNMMTKATSPAAVALAIRERSAKRRATPWASSTDRPPAARCERTKKAARP